MYSKEFGETIKTFNEVFDDIKHSEFLNDANMKSILAASKRIVKEQNQAYYYAIVETLILTVFWVISLFMLRRIIKIGYTSII